MKFSRALDLSFQLCVFAFAATGVKYFNLVFTTTTRWAFLAGLGAILLFNGIRPGAIRARFGVPLLIYGAWVTATGVWSIVPMLSLPKAGGFILTTSILLTAGWYWSAQRAGKNVLFYTAPIVAIALFSAIFDRGSAIQIGNIEVYEGLTGNPNFLGMLIAMAMPLALWWSYQSWRSGRWRIVSIGLVAVLLGSLWLSGSRASFLCVLATIGGGFAAIATSKRILVAGLVGTIAVATVVLIPTVKHSIDIRVINKAGSAEGVFFSRKYVWSESYTLAKEGGALGVGYGATAGETSLSTKESGLTAHGYGREKGNSQLAVWEETGLMGLALYALLIVAIFADLVSGWRYARDSPSRVQLGLLIGVITGFLLHSCFEAWWGAPGAPEFAFFFSTLGVASGLSNRLAASAREEPAPWRARLWRARRLTQAHASR
jgi:O-antigen ligase